MVRIIIPVTDGSGVDPHISGHFGRTPFFAIVDLNEKGQVETQRIVPNAGEHFGGGGKRAGFILNLKPNVIITHGMGPRGISIYQNERVAVLQANTDSVKGVIAAYNRGELVELTEGCHEARHP